MGRPKKESRVEADTNWNKYTDDPTAFPGLAKMEAEGKLHPLWVNQESLETGEAQAKGYRPATPEQHGVEVANLPDGSMLKNQAGQVLCVKDRKAWEAEEAERAARTPRVRTLEETIDECRKRGIDPTARGRDHLFRMHIKHSGKK